MGRAEFCNLQPTFKIMDNPEIQKAWTVVANTGYSLFLTGRAGTGKTTFLHRIKERLAKRVVVCAPTGIAAINAKGVTLHSMFQLPFAPYVPDESQLLGRKTFSLRKQKIKLIRSIDLLVIDEVSMVRADVLDAVDSVLRRYRRPDLPFGGVQLLLIGDLMQLSPVAREEDWAILKDYYATPYFFSSQALSKLPYFTIELTKVYRQSDREFIDLLNNVREGSIAPDVLSKLNTRYLPAFEPSKEDGYIRLTSHNRQADIINQRELDALDAKQHVYQAKVEGDFPELSYPVDKELVLKEGAQVMFVRNDTVQKFYNGMVGEVIRASENTIEIKPAHWNEVIKLKPCVWSNTKYELNEETGDVEEVVVGTFMQFPLRLAWAITIHKSQGLTFDRVIIDARNCFAAGQTYVALSRCRTFEGLVLSSQIGASAILTDGDVNSYHRRMPELTPTEQQLSQLAQTYFVQVASEVFDFRSLLKRFKVMLRLLEEHFYKLYPRLLNNYREMCAKMEHELVNVGQVFGTQIQSIVRDAGPDYANCDLLQERVHKAAPYFISKLEPATELFENNKISSDNKRIQQLVDSAKEALKNELTLAFGLLRLVDESGFDLQQVLRKKSELTVSNDIEDSSAEASENKTSKSKKASEVPEDILHPELFEDLRKWRNAMAAERKVAPYVVFSQKALIAMTNLQPTTIEELKLVPFVGKVIIEKYGEGILEIITKHKRDEEV